MKAAGRAVVRPIGVVGLGIMGGAMAEALRAAGRTVIGFDVDAAARRRLRRAGGTAVDSAAQVAREAEVIIVSLATSAALAATAAAFAGVKRGARPRRCVVVETSTLPIADKEAARVVLEAAGYGVLDCPISGTARRLKEGGWTIFGSGDRDAYARAEPVLRVFTERVPYVGAFGNGTKVKISANHLVAIFNVATAEAITFARKMGLDAEQFLELFGPSPVLGNGVLRLRGALMARRTYSPPTMKVEVWQKDMKVIGDMAREVDCPVPLFAACEPLYNAAMAIGLAQQDTASVCEVLGMAAGIAPAGGPGGGGAKLRRSADAARTRKRPRA